MQLWHPLPLSTLSASPTLAPRPSRVMHEPGSCSFGGLPLPLSLRPSAGPRPSRSCLHLVHVSLVVSLCHPHSAPPLALGHRGPCMDQIHATLAPSPPFHFARKPDASPPPSRVMHAPGLGSFGSFGALPPLPPHPLSLRPTATPPPLPRYRGEGSASSQWFRPQLNAPASNTKCLPVWDGGVQGVHAALVPSPLSISLSPQAHR